MDNFSYAEGGVLLFVMLIARFAFMKMFHLTKSKNWTTEDEKSAIADINLLGLAGILAIILGAVQNLIKDWFELNIWGFIVQFFFVFAPVFLLWIILWFKYKDHGNE